MKFLFERDTKCPINLGLQGLIIKESTLSRFQDRSIKRDETEHLIHGGFNEFYI